MIIKEINIQNFKSFGNKIQRILFDKDGELILLCGENGKGKSSFQEAFDFSLYGIVRGKEKKRVPMKILPNRINKSLYTGIKYINNNNDRIFIKRYLEPNKIVIQKNGVNYTKEFKTLSQEQKDQLIGFNYDIYKSFISLNMNDFLNFVNIDNNTKKKLIDKLFSIEEINDYYNITKDIIKKNNEKIHTLQSSINNNIELISNYRKTVSDKDIEKYKSKDDIKEKINDIKISYLQSVQSVKDCYSEMKNINELISERKIKLNKIKEDGIKLKNDITHIIKKLDIFNKGKCPICDSNLLDDNHLKHKDNMLLEKEEKEKELKKLKKYYTSINNEIKTYEHERKLYNIEKSKLETKTQSLKRSIEELRYEHKNFKTENYKTKIIDEINNLEKKNEDLNVSLSDVKLESEKYIKLQHIFSENGIKKDIVKELVIPINQHLTENLKKLESKFSVILDDEFNAVVYERLVNEIPIESLSVGEMRKINIAIAMSYMESIFSIRKCNILFIDEVFSSIDETNVAILLQTFKTFAKKHKINIIIVNHSFMEESFFDRIIKVEKKYFSDIVEIKK